jgi:predicted Zn-dependent protease
MRILPGLIAVMALPAQDRPYSQEKEAALGAQLSNQVRRQTTAVENQAIQSYVDRLGKKLAAQFPGADVNYRFATVTDSLGGRTHEPLALPGGYVFVSTGLLQEAQDEAELAGMLAHAMAHIANRDSSRLAGERPIINYGSIPLVFLGGWNGANGDNMAVPVGFLKTQRIYELDADRQAVRVTSGAGYDPAALLRYIRRVQPSNTSRVFASLPPLPDRAAAIEAAILELPPTEFERIRKELQPVESQKPRPVPSLLR